jgi:O-antigen/teichoic acid export membrane protein
MLRSIKALTFQTLIYGTGHILARAVTFLLLPLYTHVFTAHEYGIISLTYAFMGFMIVILHYGLDAALMKWYTPAGPEERSRYLSTTYVSYLVTTTGVALVLFALRRWLAPVLLGGDYPHLLALVAAILFFDVLLAVPLLQLRSEGRPLAFVGISLISVVISLTLNFLLVLKYHMGIQGVLLSNLITSGIVFFLTLPIVVRRLQVKAVSFQTWRRLARFGLPFLPAGAFAMLMELADRYLLKIMTDIETVGIYSAGYKLGMLMLLLVVGFNTGWHPFFLRQKDSRETRRMFARITSLVMALLGFTWVLMVLWIPRLLRLDIGPVTIYGPEFWESEKIVPLIALGYFFHAAYLLQLPGVFLRERSQWVAVTRGAGALANIGLNLALIPFYGAQGAALATCLSFFIMAFLFWGVNRKIYPLPLEWGRLVRIAAFMALAYSLAWFIPATVVRDLLLTLLYPLGLVFTGFLTAGERTLLKGVFSNFSVRRSTR